MRIIDIFHDLRHAIRSLRRSPAFSVAAILTVALGIGVNTAVFNVVYAVLLDPLPYRDPGRLVHLAQTHPDFLSYQTAVPDFFDWQASAKASRR
jgi:putative ABC transport system permease protein